jgi:Holliday junction resolvase
MTEAMIERKVCDYARKVGWRPIKLSGMHDVGKPDKMFLRNGETVFIEFKATGKKPTDLQLKWLEDLRKWGFRATWVDNVTDGRKFLGAKK